MSARGQAVPSYLKVIQYLKCLFRLQLTKTSGVFTWFSCTYAGLDVVQHVAISHIFVGCSNPPVIYLDHLHSTHEREQF